MFNLAFTVELSEKIEMFYKKNGLIERKSVKYIYMIGYEGYPI